MSAGGCSPVRWGANIPPLQYDPQVFTYAEEGNVNALKKCPLIDKLQRNKEGLMPIHVAAVNDQLEVVQHLMRLTAPRLSRNNEKMIDQTTKAGDTVFHLAAAHGSEKVIGYLSSLYSCFGFLHKRNEASLLPLHVAAEKGNKTILGMLLQNIPQNFLPLKCNKGGTALHYAVKGKSLEAIEFLLEQGADPKIGDNSGNTALHWAKMYDCSEEIVNALIEKGADPEQKNHFGLTYLEIHKIET